MDTSQQPKSADEIATVRASWITLVVGVLVLGIKFYAFHVTRSQAIFSDALESIVNVITAAIGIFVVTISAKPADEDHPYGHGKIEYFSAAFEGGLITFAAIAVALEIINSAMAGRELRALDLGMAITVGASVLNLILGFYLQYVGKKHHSIALTGSAHHIFSDVWTSGSIIVGFILIKATGIMWIDLVVAGVIGLQLGWTGVKLVIQSINGLMDAGDRGLLEKLRVIFEKVRIPGIIRIHYVRVIKSGRYHHVDAHVVIPEFWDIGEAHDRTNIFEQKVFSEEGKLDKDSKSPMMGEIHFHLDPCRRVYCKACEMRDCPIRQAPFDKREPFTIEELLSPIEPDEFR